MVSPLGAFTIPLSPMSYKCIALKIMVQYSCPEGCTVLVKQLTDLVEAYDRNVILAPYPDMEYRIALTAWNRIDTLDAFDEGRIIKFINEYQGLDHHQ